MTINPAPALLPRDPSPPICHQLRVIEDLDPDDSAWPVRSIARRRWLAMLSDRLPGSPLTFSLSAPGMPEVRVCGAVVSIPPANRRVDPYAILSGHATELGLARDGPHPWAEFAAADCYPCGLVMLPHYQCLAYGPGAHDTGALDALINALDYWRHAHRLRSLAFLYLTPDAEALTERLAIAGYTVLPLTTRCELDVSWTDFEGYLHTFAKKRRVAILRELRDLVEREITVRERELDTCVPELVALRCSLAEKYGGRPDPERERNLFARVHRVFPGPDTTVVVAEVDGRIIGFTLFLRDDEDWTAYICGSDNSVQSRLTYFATSYYYPAELAPRLGIRRISYGPGSWEAKRLRGCRETPLYAAALPPTPPA